MALVPSALQGLLIAEFASSGILGTASPSLATALSLGISTSILAQAMVTTVDVGTLGAGVGNGTVVGLTSAVLGPLMVGTFASQGLLGVYSASLALAISNAFATWFLTAQAITASAGVGVGSGVGTIIGLDPGSMGSTIAGMMAANGLLGPASIQLANAVAQAIVPAVMTNSVVIVVIAGPPSIVPGAGSGTGKVL